MISGFVIEAEIAPPLNADYHRGEKKKYESVFKSGGNILDQSASKR